MAHTPQSIVFGARRRSLTVHVPGRFAVTSACAGAEVDGMPEDVDGAKRSELEEWLESEADMGSELSPHCCRRASRSGAPCC
jgi:hypothetical protein